VATQYADGVFVTVGTRDGLYVFEGDQERRNWTRRGPSLTGLDISHAILDPRDERTIWVAANGEDHAAVYRSLDRGETWEMAGEPLPVKRAWHVQPALAETPDRVYAGVADAALYQSDDAGRSWREVDSLSNHETRSEWMEGGGGLCLHTILTNPDRPDELVIAMSAVGVFYSADSGRTWEPRNEGTFSFADMDFGDGPRDIQFRSVHRCVHKVVRNPANGHLFQQNHDGVYRSEDDGLTWLDISDGLPERFGFVIGATADGSVYVVPQQVNMEAFTVRASGQLTVYRSRDLGQTWEPLSEGLPVIENVTLYREGMATDLHAAGGVYIGTSDGRLLSTRDGGQCWEHLAEGLPPVRSVSCEHITN